MVAAVRGACPVKSDGSDLEFTVTDVSVRPIARDCRRPGEPVARSASRDPTPRHRLRALRKLWLRGRPPLPPSPILPSRTPLTVVVTGNGRRRSINETFGTRWPPKNAVSLRRRRRPDEFHLETVCPEKTYEERNRNATVTFFCFLGQRRRVAVFTATPRHSSNGIPSSENVIPYARTAGNSGILPAGCVSAKSFLRQ